ncbi:MAG: GNAT family protein [Chloroflexota bacterium]|nr:GNAT family protein [Chloroflexota bacterium]
MESIILEDTLVRMRPIAAQDIPNIQRLAAAEEIARNTFVPHPYPPEAAADFVQKAQEHWQLDEGFVFAIIEKAGGQFAGCMGIHPTPAHNRAEVGYWIGLPYWGRGLATAALRLLIQFGFEELQLNRIAAGHFPQNPASGRVMQKADMRYEGRLRGARYHRGEYKDEVRYAILRRDYEARQAPAGTGITKETAED